MDPSRRPARSASVSSRAARVRAAWALARGALPCALVAAACGVATDPSPAGLNGTWNGRVSYGSASPGGHCYARFLAGLGGAGHLYTISLELSQDGSRLSGTLRGTQIPTSCRFEGQVSGEQVAWRQTACDQACATLQEGACGAFRLCVVDHSFAGRKTGRGLEGAHAVAWDTTDASGSPLGRLDIQARLEAGP